MVLLGTLSAACSSPSSPVAPSPPPPLREAVDGPSVTLGLGHGEPTIRLDAAGFRAATDVYVEIEWQGDVWYRGFARGVWWFTAADHWEYRFTLDGAGHRMGIELWRGRPIDGDGVLGILSFQNDNHLPLRSVRAWVDGKEARTRVLGPRDPLRHGDVGPRDPASVARR